MLPLFVRCVNLKAAIYFFLFTSFMALHGLVIHTEKDPAKVTNGQVTFYIILLQVRKSLFYLEVHHNHICLSYFYQE